MIISVKVHEGKNKPEMKNEVLHVYTIEKRENNRANADVVKQLASYYGVEASGIRIVRGRTARNKIFSIEKEE